MSEEKPKKNTIQRANEIALGDEETDVNLFQPFAQNSEIKDNVDSAIDKNRKAELDAEGEDSVRSKNLRLERQVIYYQNELGQKDQQLVARPEALDNVSEYAVEEKEDLGEIHDWFSAKQVNWKKELARRITFKLTNYIMAGIGIIILLFSGSFTAPIIAAVVSNPYIVVAILAFATIDLYIFLTWYRKK